MGLITGVTYNDFVSGEPPTSTEWQKYANLATELTTDWEDYSSSFVLSASTTPPTKGNSTYTALYNKIGKTVDAIIYVQIGNSGWNAGSGNYSWSLPVEALNRFLVVGTMYIFDNGTGPRTGVVYGASSTTLAGVVGTSVITHASPQAWAASDEMIIRVRYPALT